DQLLARALDLAETIAKQPPLAAQAAKKAVRAARELPLSQGLLFERELGRQTFATEDRAEGMRAFVERRTPEFKGR
ncbi:MAG: enoyl-CoA hydratase-related protein, partial [Pseudomonadota bacterium]